MLSNDDADVAAVVDKAIETGSRHPQQTEGGENQHLSSVSVIVVSVIGGGELG